jgi:hypothetical protein
MSAYEFVAMLLLVIWSPLVECARVALVGIALVALLFVASDVIAWIQLERGE